MPKEAKGKHPKESIKPLSGLDVDALLGQSKRTKISADNSVPEFKQALSSTTSVDQIEDIVKQMGKIIRTLISTSTGEINYERALENISVMREKMIAIEEPELYNSFLRNLKAKLAAEELGGPRKDMWWKIRYSHLGLITNLESDVSRVTHNESLEVCAPVLLCPSHRC